jgi:hypothetical protein
MRNTATILVITLLTAACGGKNTESNVETPGEEVKKRVVKAKPSKLERTSFKTKVR